MGTISDELDLVLLSTVPDARPMNTLTNQQTPLDEPDIQGLAPIECSNPSELDQPTSAPDGVEFVARIPARADEFVRSVAPLDLDTLRAHHLELAMAVIELAADAGSPLPWGHDDPTVALLRAAAKLALTAPSATSSAAADLIASFGSTGSGDS